MKSIEVGARYRHYKGGLYEVLALGIHTETDEEVVVYQDPIERGRVWVRPSEIFAGTVRVEGKTIPRFAPSTS